MHLEDGTLANVTDICFPDGKTILRKKYNKTREMKSFLNRMKICVCRVKGVTAFQAKKKKKGKTPAPKYLWYNF